MVSLEIHLRCSWDLRHRVFLLILVVGYHFFPVFQSQLVSLVITEFMNLIKQDWDDCSMNCCPMKKLGCSRRHVVDPQMSRSEVKNWQYLKHFGSLNADLLKQRPCLAKNTLDYLYIIMINDDIAYQCAPSAEQSSSSWSSLHNVETISIDMFVQFL